MNPINQYSSLIGRLLISVIFLMAGISKITGYAATQSYMEAMGVPGHLLPLVIGTEILGAIAIIIGFQTRAIAFLLAGFSIASGFFFHFDFNDQTQSVMFMKNIAIAGGFLFLIANGAGQLSLDARLAK